MGSEENIWVVIPAAGVGSRMKSTTPKQYMMLNQAPVIEHTLSLFKHTAEIREIVIAISPADEYWDSLDDKIKLNVTVINGGNERCDSVLNGLRELENRVQLNDWVLVHDAARPCLRRDDLELLIKKLSGNEVGGILAIPVRDTMKRSGKRAGRLEGEEQSFIEETIEREHLWHALTPQMFRYGLLKEALESALNDGRRITDEASAMEVAGYNPLLIEGHADNLKITRPEDLELAAFYLRQQEN